MVVAGARAGAKRKQAESLGVKVITGDEFLRIVAEHEQKSLVKDESSSSASNAETTDLIESTENQSPVSTGSSTPPFSNMSVVFSGSIATNVTRQKAQEWARQLGATSTPSQVTKSTGTLVVGSKAAPSKVTKAETLGIPVMDAEAFLRISAANNLFVDGTDKTDVSE
jgi:NAD-dependent DNA ligase